jgi:peroxiredoxin
MDLSFTREIRVPVGDPKLAAIDIKKFLTINIGEQAPEFVATTLDGKELKLGDLRGKVVLLDFWATWCGPCIAELPNLQWAHKQFGLGGELVVVGISLDSNKDAVKEFVAKRDIHWRQIALGPAEQNPVAKEYTVSGVPATFLIGRDGKVVARDIQGWRLRTELKKLFSGPSEQTQASQ